jgi:apolipoprotein N-acyltransferase
MTRIDKRRSDRLRQAARTSDRSTRADSGRSAGPGPLTPLWASPLSLSLASGGLLWAALPPLSWWPLAWVAPVFWLRLAQRTQLGGRYPYAAVWVASAVYWMVVMQGIRLAHWANYLGLVALGAYLGIYIPLFLAVTRLAVHRWRIPLWVAAPVAWTGLELMRGYGPLGFSMALLAHTQVSQPLVIQIADLFGAYGVSFVIMLVASAAVSVVAATRPHKLWPLLPAGAVLAASLVYGWYRLGEPTESDPDRPPVRVALIQGSIDTVFEDNPNRPSQILEQYSDLTLEARRRYGELDLVVWPETMFPVDEILVDDRARNPQLDPSWDPSTAWGMVADNAELFRRVIRNGVRRINEPLTEDHSDSRPTYWMLGTTTWLLGDHPPRRYNTAMLVDPQAQVVGRYFKMHPVLFGEYVPFGEWIPALYHLFPLPNGLTPGTQPLAVTVADLTMTVSICFESTMPHMIRRHVVALRRQGRSPEVLVNLTNDGWFWGSSILDMQLDCAVFRAIELRRPFLVAANTGFSAWIDGNGRVLAQGPRRATGTLLALVRPDGRASGYERWGDGPLGLCALFCLVIVLGSPLAVGLRRCRPAAAHRGGDSTAQAPHPDPRSAERADGSSGG